MITLAVSINVYRLNHMQKKHSADMDEILKILRQLNNRRLF